MGGKKPYHPILRREPLLSLSSMTCHEMAMRQGGWWWRCWLVVTCRVDNWRISSKSFQSLKYSCDHVESYYVKLQNHSTSTSTTTYTYGQRYKKRWAIGIRHFCFFQFFSLTLSPIGLPTLHEDEEQQQKGLNSEMRKTRPTVIKRRPTKRRPTHKLEGEGSGRGGDPWYIFFYYSSLLTFFYRYSIDYI